MRPLRAALLAAALAAPLLAAVTRAGEPVRPGDPPPDAGPDAAPPAPPLPVLEAEPFPDKHSGMPKDAEWKDATEVTIHRWSNALFAARQGENATCHVHRLREWVRVRCSTTGGVLLLGGSADGLWLTDGTATFPVRRGDRREIEFLAEETSFTGYRGMEEHHRSAFSFTLSEQWAPGDDHPWIVADGS